MKSDSLRPSPSTPLIWTVRSLRRLTSYSSKRQQSGQEEAREGRRWGEGGKEEEGGGKEDGGKGEEEGGGGNEKG